MISVSAKNINKVFVDLINIIKNIVFFSSFGEIEVQYYVVSTFPFLWIFCRGEFSYFLSSDIVGWDLGLGFCWLCCEDDDGGDDDYDEWRCVDIVFGPIVCVFYK